MVERVLGDPQIAEAERLGALRDAPQLAHVDRFRRAVRQRDAEVDLVLQRHCPASPRWTYIPLPIVIPGRRAAASPASIFQRLVFMDSGPRPSADPGMTRWGSGALVTPSRSLPSASRRDIRRS